LKNLKRLDINPAGEVFSSKPSRRILEMVSRETCPDLYIDIISNGTLFTEKEWRKLPNLKGMVHSVRISTDAATKATFESLRRLAVWEVFIENMGFLGRLRKNGEIGQLKISFTYQLGNFREMAAFVDFAKSFNCDFAIFERLQNLGAFTWDEFRARAVHLSEHPLHDEFLSTVANPIFAQQAVWHDFEWEGAASLSEEDARARLVAFG
jgi:MoaA/NifB/PqqE/SkfB family radical SAM enzyme